MDNKQMLIEEALDNLCKATGRDIFIVRPEKEEDVIPYLKAELEKTIAKL